MKILVLGSGGREHALVWRLAQEGHQVIAAPGNPGAAEVAERVPVALEDAEAVLALARDRAVELVVVGPEAPLVAGLADHLRAAGVAVFGPGRAGAQLEGSKVYAKQFFARHGIRTAPFAVVGSAAEVDAAIDELGGALVVKADGLCAGKGVVICDHADEVRAAAAEMLGGRFGAAGQRLVLEQKLRGREVSVLALTDGRALEVLAPAEDHKRIFDGDRGPNTGGMGTVSPAWSPPEVLARVRAELLEPTVAGLAADGVDYRGVLYAGVMVDEAGCPWLLEYNCRFGDPETQPIVRRARGELGRALLGAAHGALPADALDWDPRVAVCVVVAAAGYPGTPRLGDVIGGAGGPWPEEVVVFHAGTARRGEELVTAGGRVLGVTALGATVAEARSRAYAAVDAISLEGKQARRDIGLRGG
ncbi:MAG: phosphoribosylamine--glycine ligase [Kofleriaceae bacterium]